MSFINIFNFKKYFTKPSDAQVARIGHVNAVYDALNNPTTVQVTDGGTFTAFTNVPVTLEKTSDYGIIELTYGGTTPSIPASAWVFTVTLDITNLTPGAKLFASATTGTDYVDSEVGLRQIIQVENPVNTEDNIITFRIFSAIASTSVVNINVEYGMKVKIFYTLIEY